HASELDEQQWQTVIRNCCLMHGWILDLEKNAVKPAPQAVSNKRSNDTRAPVNTTTEAVTEPPKDLPAPSVDSLPATVGRKPTSSSQQTQDESKIPKEPPPPYEKTPSVSRRDIEALLPKKISSFPSFVVNDASKVSVSLVSHALQESMARNSFTATSFEGEVSGGFKGIGVGLSGGASDTKHDAEGSVTTTSEKKIIADFKFPRATLYLHAEDLEPTAELRAAIEKVRRTKNVNDLRDLHARFGHFFCHEVVVGGALQTSRFTSGTHTVSESRQKEDFKAQVGFAASSPKGLAGSMKASRQKSKDDSDGSDEMTVTDKQAFEAIGGNAILASNPPEWCVSVLPYQNWRTVERAEMAMLGTALSQCADKTLTHVKEWFLEAVPLLSEYLSIPQSRVIDVRLKIASHIPGLTSAVNSAEKRQHDVCNYLGHQFGRPVYPVRMGLKRRKSVTEEQVTRSEKSFGLTVNDLTKTYKQFDVQTQVALFSPAQFQAPVLLQYEDMHRRIEQLSVEEYQETIWQLVVPSGEHLKHDSLVAIRIYHEKVNLYLSVFRNAQGHFLPGITDSGETPYWRIKKVNSSGTGVSGSFIREGDAIRFCWCFADQTSGFRDYHQDFYGRRRFTKPADAPAELYFKTPFPGFEQAKSRKGAAMMMFGNADVKPVLALLNVVPDQHVGDDKITYNLFDVSFRIDLVG
ncbi:hypothetical protein BDW02DRAFT_485813, partial [Decorospora gaudefroyi]